VASKDPSTRLVLIDSGEKLAIGGSNGHVTLFDSKSLSKVFSLVAHDDYPVTGLAFAPASVASADGMNCFLITCSVDNRMATIISRKLSVLVLLAVLLVLFAFSIFIFLRNGL
jgi:WD40 repeat protein